MAASGGTGSTAVAKVNIHSIQARRRHAARQRTRDRGSTSCDLVDAKQQTTTKHNCVVADALVVLLSVEFDSLDRHAPCRVSQGIASNRTECAHGAVRSEEPNVVVDEGGM